RGNWKDFIEVMLRK
ncbi:protein YpfM, partial [Escherichia coli]